MQPLVIDSNEKLRFIDCYSAEHQNPAVSGRTNVIDCVHISPPNCIEKAQKWLSIHKKDPHVSIEAVINHIEKSGDLKGHKISESHGDGSVTFYIHKVLYLQK